LREVFHARRSLVCAYTYDQLALVLAGERERPTVEPFLMELLALELRAQVVCAFHLPYAGAIVAIWCPLTPPTDETHGHTHKSAAHNLTLRRGIWARA